LPGCQVQQIIAQTVIGAGIIDNENGRLVADVPQAVDYAVEALQSGFPRIVDRDDNVDDLCWLLHSCSLVLPLNLPAVTGQAAHMRQFYVIADGSIAYRIFPENA